MVRQAELTALRATVRETIDQQRLGTPRFLRCIARAGDREQLEATLDDLASLGESWFGSQPAQRHRLGADSRLYLTELLKWPEGQGALLTVSSAAGGLPRFDLMLIGSRGTLYHEM